MDEMATQVTRAENDGFIFEEAVEYFSGKLPVTAAQFKKLSDEHRALAFTVSGYTAIQILNAFHGELLHAIEQGETVNSFRDNMNNFLSSKGYDGISNFQADNIFRTNVQTAYQSGHYKRMTEPAVMKLRPYWQYNAVDDDATRPSHLAMSGKVFPADSPVWDTWYPPNGYRCRCSVTSLSKRQVEARGLTVEETVPAGIDLPGGGYAIMKPDAGFRTNPAKAKFSPDLDGYPETLVKAYEKKTGVIK